MSSIPLPALDIKPPEQIDIASQLGKVAQLRSLGQQQQIQQQNIQEGQQKLAQTQALNDSFKNALTTDPQGNPTFDRNKVIQSVSAAGQGSLVPKLNQSFMEMDKLAGEVQKTRDEHNAAAVDYLGSTAKTVQDSGYNPVIAGAAFAHAAAAGYGPEVQQILQQVNQDPSKLPQVIDSIISSSKTQTESAKNAAQGQDAASNTQLHQAQLPGAVAESAQKQRIATGTSPTGVTAEQQLTQKDRADQLRMEAQRNFMESKRLNEEHRHNMVAEGGTPSQIPAGVTGDDALKLMDPQRAAAVKMVGDAKVDLPTMLSRMPPGAKMSFMQDLNSYKPGYGQATYGIEKGVTKDFTSGPDAQKLQAFNTAITHMGVFKNAADALDNGDIKALNSAGNTLGTQFGSDKTTNFSIARQAFIGEVTRAFDGAGVTMHDREQVESQISSASSPKQLKGAADTAEKLLRGKRDVLKQQFDAGQKGQPNFGDSTNSAPKSSGNDPFAAFGGRARQ